MTWKLTFYGVAMGLLGAAIALIVQAQSATPSPSQCGGQVSGMPQVLQFSNNNCIAVPPGPTANTCWIEVVNQVPTFQCADGTLMQFTLATWP